MREWFWYAVLYSFLGFLLEVAYARAVRAEKQDRKCFYFLPLCPVYGLGALLILTPAPLLAGRPLLLALWSGAAATEAEYAMSLFYEKLFRVSFWDYTALPWNLGGRVCLAFSLCWCGLGLLTVYGVHPLAAALVARIPEGLTLPCALLLGADALWTAAVLRRSGSTDALIWYARRPRRQAQEVRGGEDSGISGI